MKKTLFKILNFIEKVVVKLKKKINNNNKKHIEYIKKIMYHKSVKHNYDPDERYNYLNNKLVLGRKIQSKNQNMFII
jgi:hypothetical protein